MKLAAATVAFAASANAFAPSTTGNVSTNKHRRIVHLSQQEKGMTNHCFVVLFSSAPLN
jgi:hypothetical protein